MKNLIVLMAFIVIIAGCSSAGPGVIPDENLNGTNSGSLPEWTPVAPNPDGSSILGLYQLDLDPVLVSAELTSLRNGSLYDVLETVDITNFLTATPCWDCVKLKSVSLDPDGSLVVLIGIKHPFPAGDPYKPITGKNRADLHIFNVEGIVISDSPVVNFPFTNQKSVDFMMTNADGYTAYLDKSLDEIFLTDATIHPYILHFDDYTEGNFDPDNPMGFASVTLPPPTGNLVMAQGSDYDFQPYKFKIENSVSFIYAVGCTYAVTATSKNERFTPEYRIPQHNKKAASEVSIEVTRNNLVAGNAMSDADLEIHVVDISNGVPVGDGLGEMFDDSSVSELVLEIPGVIQDGIIIDGGTAISGTGHSPSDPLVYQATIANELGADAGVYRGLVKVLDNYTPGLNTNGGIAGYDGMGRVDPVDNPLSALFMITEFATWQTFEIEVSVSACGPITGEILSPNPCPDNLGNGATVDFEVTASSANGGGSIVLYEVDYDYDGVSFTTDMSNSDGIFDDVGPFLVPAPCEDNIPYSYTVAFRATDECVPANVTIFATCEVTVTSCLMPVGNVWITVNRVPVYWTSTLPPYTVFHVGDKFDPAGEWTIHWDSVPLAEEYAIYCDTNPGNYASPTWSEDELTDNLGSSPIGTTTGTSFTVPVGHVPSNRYVIGNTYVVRARAAAGDQSSEVGNSEPAFIMANGWETAPVDSPIMNPALFEGWQAGWETTYSPGTWYHFPTTDNDTQNLLAGTNGARMSSCYIGSLAHVGRWTSLVKRTPTVPDAPVRFLDFTIQAWNSNTTTASVGGIIIGTCAIQPGHPWTTPADFEWALASTEAPFEGYNNSSDTFLLNTFDGVETDEPWCMQAFSLYSYPMDVAFRLGGDVNLTANPNDPFVGYAAAKVAYTTHDHDNWFTDDLAVMIY